MRQNIKLIKISADYADEIKAYKDEFIDAGDSMDGCGALRRIDDPYEYVEWSINCESLETMAKDRIYEGRVPATQLMLVSEDEHRLLGLLQIRHYFNDYLSKFGGHIGYSVRPSERRKGYAKQMLTEALAFCRDLGLDRVLITCYDTNIASEKTILSCDGVYESTIFEPDEKAYFKRFWIEL